MARESYYRAKCGYEGCNEFTRYTYSTHDMTKAFEEVENEHA